MRYHTLGYTEQIFVLDGVPILFRNGMADIRDEQLILRIPPHHTILNESGNAVLRPDGMDTKKKPKTR